MPQVPTVSRLTPADLDRVLDRQLTVSVTQYAQITGENPARVRALIMRGAFRFPVIRPFGRLAMIRTETLRAALGGQQIHAHTLTRRLLAQDPDALEIARGLAAGDPRYRLTADGSIIDSRSLPLGPTAAERRLDASPTLPLAEAARLIGMSYMSLDHQARAGRLRLEVLGEPTRGRGNGRHVRSGDLRRLIAEAPEHHAAPAAAAAAA